VAQHAVLVDGNAGTRIVCIAGIKASDDVQPGATPQLILKISSSALVLDPAFRRRIPDVGRHTIGSRRFLAVKAKSPFECSGLTLTQPMHIVLAGLTGKYE
jgi:hypothetical protein